MDVYEINQAVQDLFDASAGANDAYGFDSAWTAIDDYCKDQDLLDENAGLVAESLLKSEANVLAALQQSHQRQGKQKAASDTRKKVWVFLVDLLSRLDSQQVAEYAPKIIQAASHHGRVEENAHVRNAALDALTYVLTQITDGNIPVSVLPDSPANLAASLQRLYLSSEARDKSTLKASLLGVLGLLLQLMDRYNPAGAAATAATLSQQQGSAGFASSQHASRTAAPKISGVEVLNRHWLLQMCRGELTEGGGQLSSAKASEGTVEGMTAALCLMQPGEADADLSAMLNLTCTLLHELAQALTYKNKYEKYGRYKAATACLQQLGQRMAAARLFTQAAPAGLSTAVGTGAGQGPASVGAVLIHDLMVICAGSPNKDMRNAAADAMAAVAGLICTELLQSRSPDGSAVVQSIIRICNEEFAGVGATATAAAARRGDAGTAGAGREGSPEVLTGSGWMRGAVEVLGRLVPAVAAHQGVQVVLQG